MADIQTFKTLQDKVLAWLDEAGDTDTTRTLVKYALQTANKKRATQEGWPFMFFPTQQLTLVAGQQYYALHSEYFKPFYFWNRNAQDYMSQYDEASLVSSRVDQNNDTSDLSVKFTLFGRAEVAMQPTAASAITIASSISGDNGTKTVTVTGDTASGVRTESIACGAAGTVLFTTIIKVRKSGDWLGTMTMSSNAGAVINLVLFNTEVGRSYQQIKILTKPTQSETVDYQFYRQPSPMTADDDRPDIPTPFEDLLVYDSLLSFASYNQYDGQVVQLWQFNQRDLLLGLQQAYSDSKAVQAAASYTEYIPR